MGSKIFPSTHGRKVGVIDADLLDPGRVDIWLDPGQPQQRHVVTLPLNNQSYIKSFEKNFWEFPGKRGQHLEVCSSINAL